MELAQEHKEEAVFSTINTFDKINEQIDVHGMNRARALEIVKARIEITQTELNKGLEPNVGNGKDHIFKIVCGRGSHS